MKRSRTQWLGRIEGVSLVALLWVAMPLKYGFGVAGAVKVVGQVHGLVFLAYVIVLAFTGRRQRWPASRVVWGVVSSMIPGGFVFFEASLRLDEVHETHLSTPSSSKDSSSELRA
jgi:integral membrane protein